MDLEVVPPLLSVLFVDDYFALQQSASSVSKSDSQVKLYKYALVRNTCLYLLIPNKFRFYA